jgi:hypothetical protein
MKNEASHKIRRSPPCGTQRWSRSGPRSAHFFDRPGPGIPSRSQGRPSVATSTAPEGSVRRRAWGPRCIARAGRLMLSTNPDEQLRARELWSVFVAGLILTLSAHCQADEDFSLSATPKMTNPVGPGFVGALALPSLLSLIECKAMAEFVSPIRGAI